MYRYLLTFSVLHDIPEGIAIDVRYLLDPRKYVEFLEPRDIAIVPSSNFSDIESQRKILILIKRNELYSDYGVRKFCSEVTIAGYLYNCFKSNLQKDQEYYKKRDGFYDMFTILDEVNFARNKGLGIFNELAKFFHIFKEEPKPVGQQMLTDDLCKFGLGTLFLAYSHVDG